MFAEAGVTAESLRYYLLYWDKVVIADSHYMKTALSDEMELLSKANILTKEVGPAANSGGSDNQDLDVQHLTSVATVAAKLYGKNPGQWSVHQTGDSLIFPQSMSRELITADIELNACLPVPPATFPLEKLLEFKLRRSDELSILRIALAECNHPASTHYLTALYAVIGLM